MLLCNEFIIFKLLNMLKFVLIFHMVNINRYNPYKQKLFGALNTFNVMVSIDQNGNVQVNTTKN